jgi:hypothetical protein
MNVRYSLAASLLIISPLAAAQPPACKGNLAKPPFDWQQEMVELDKAAFAIGTRWTQDPEWTSLGISDRLKKREAAIEEVYTKLRERRKAQYLAAQCTIEHTKRCASTAGQRNVCPQSVAAPSGTQFIPSSIELIENDFDSGGSPTASSDNTSVHYAVKKTGNGSNTAGFRALVEFNPGEINGWVDREVARSQDYFGPLLRSQNLNVTGNVQISTSP